MLRRSGTTNPLGVLLLLGLLSLANAHEMDEMNTSMRKTLATVQASETVLSQTYFHHDANNTRFMTAHIILMTISWVFMLPVCVMLSISRSRYRFLVQFAFLATNAVGILLVVIYNASTPDLYPNNAHHKLGWVLTWIVGAQLLLGFISTYAERKPQNNHEERASFVPVSQEAIAEHQRINGTGYQDEYRFSRDSGHGTEPLTESLRSHSVSSVGSDHLPLPEMRNNILEEDVEEVNLLYGSKLGHLFSSTISGSVYSKLLRAIRLFYDFTDFYIIVLAWMGLLTGWVTYGGFFIGDRVYSGLAHLIKGSVFFWFGIVSLGRWAGAWSRSGWAWNIKPSKKDRPTAEFVESSLVFIYGITNVFMEHLNAWGSEWSPQDLEHLAITFLFIGGGLCGLLIESTRVRNFLNVTTEHRSSPQGEKKKQAAEPKSYGFSMNPFPGLVTLLVGIMMSSHHQDSMISTMIHKQWGSLLVAAAFCRGVTYIIYHISPPTSTLAGRPPTELITSFCLMAGGFIFMASARDIVTAIEANGLDAMFVFTVSMGLITAMMAWIITIIAIKGWATQKEWRFKYGYCPVSTAA